MLVYEELKRSSVPNTHTHSQTLTHLSDPVCQTAQGPTAPFCCTCERVLVCVCVFVCVCVCVCVCVSTVYLHMYFCLYLDSRICSPLLFGSRSVCSMGSISVVSSTGRACLLLTPSTWPSGAVDSAAFFASRSVLRSCDELEGNGCDLRETCL
jgi:hypothetical protein